MAHRARFRIKITKTGYLFIALCLAVGVAALNTGNNLLYLVFSMMCSFIVLSGLLSNNTLTRLRIRPVFPGRIFANQDVPVQIEMENGKRYLPSFSLSLVAQTKGPDSGKGVFVVKIPPQKSESTTDFVRFPRRGKSELPPYIVETTYPFGLIRKFIGVPSEGETLVYPELLNLVATLESDRRFQGDFLSGQKGGASNPYGIRDFVSGDPARLIHWKTSARSGQLKVKEFEKEKRLRVSLELELAAGTRDPRLRERAISAAASLLLLLISRNYELSLKINGEKIEPKGRGYLDAYLSALALARPPERHHSAVAIEENVALLTDRSDLSPPQSCILFWGPREIEKL
jgi:uncharacterized protein (DUF58 family)